MVKTIKRNNRAKDALLFGLRAVKAFLDFTFEGPLLCDLPIFTFVEAAAIAEKKKENEKAQDGMELSSEKVYERVNSFMF